MAVRTDFKTGVRLDRTGGARFRSFSAKAVAVAFLFFAGLAAPLAAQQDTLRRPVPPRIDTLFVDSLARIDTVVAVPVAPQPPEASRPISPGGAFLQSLLIPGRGQITLGKKNASRFYFLVEALGIGMTIKSYGDLREAKRNEGDSIAVEWDVDPVTGDSTPSRFEPGRFTPELTNARRTHVEDWIALLIFNHLLSAADAYVAANLWDFPAKVSVRARPPGAYARTGDGGLPPPALNLEARITGTITW